MPIRAADAAPFGVTDPDRRWSIWRCEQGCIHIALARVLMTMSDDDFRALVHLLNCASSELGAGRHEVKVAGVH